VLLWGDVNGKSGGLEVPFGEIIRVPLNQGYSCCRDDTPHSLGFIPLCRLYYPQLRGEIIAVGIAKAEFHYGVSKQFQERADEISEEILKQIENIRSRLYLEEDKSKEGVLNG